MYLWLYKKLLERKINQLDLLFCNSNYTKAMTEKYWNKYGIREPVIVYPPVEEAFWSNKPLNQRTNRVLYVARFIPGKRHEILKQLAISFPNLQFVSAGLLRNSEEGWFENFKKNLPTNYTLKPNLNESDLVKLFQDSTIYCHLMEREHFGIAPMEALASGCITLTHNSGGSADFIPDEFRWNTVEDLKEKINKLASTEGFEAWKQKKEALQKKISVLRPQSFQDQIWANVADLMEHT
jgi:glycosyltransferase involved in cell wall biosynthesis